MNNEFNCDCRLCNNKTSFKMPIGVVEAAKQGRLVLFCGAGISTENKNVLPLSFYSTIQDELGISDGNLSFSDTMQQYCNFPDGRRKLMRKIRERFQYIHSFPELENMATMFHRELSELHFVKTIITTNWDTYFEEYCSAIPITIPEDFVYWNEKDRCVLKIHGSINNLGTIVATKDDYLECEKRLEKGIIGATLKTILANNTVVFIGFSFGDEDFIQILDYLKKEMKDYLPHIYIVTVDPYLKDKIKYKDTTCIVTDGTFFLHQLKLKLIDDKLIVNSNALPIVDMQRNLLGNIHEKVSNIDFHTYPEVIYCLAYQDGVLHAFDRFIQLYDNGEYNIPGYVEKLVRYYDNLCKRKKESGDFWDAAYYEGYENGLMFIIVCEEDVSLIKEFPKFYLPNAKCELNSYDMFIKELERVNKQKDDYYKYSIKVTSNLKNSKNTVVHHPPY